MHFHDMRVGTLATTSLINEPRVWPRLGLVGPDDPGGHRDMNYADLVRSALVLEPFFAESAYLGYSLAPTKLCATRSCATTEAVAQAARVWRSRGLDAEARMYRATGGINTHKGAIFLLGLLAFAWGRAVRQSRSTWSGSTWPRSTWSREPFPVIASEQVLDIAYRAMARTLAAEQRSHRAALSETYGQWASRRFGWGGMRHTVISNFHGLRQVLGLRQTMRGLPRASQLAAARVHLFVNSQDTNLLKRAGWRRTQETLGQARHALRVGGVGTAAGRHCLTELDRTMADNRWSASGAGDLLAAFLFLDGLERGHVNAITVRPTSAREVARL